MNSESVTPGYNQLECISLFVTTASHSISVPHENSPWTEYRKRPPVLLQFYLKHPLITHLQLHIFLFNKIWNAVHIHVSLSRTDALIHPDILFRYAVMFYTTISSHPSAPLPSKYACRIIVFVNIHIDYLLHSAPWLF